MTVSYDRRTKKAVVTKKKRPTRVRRQFDSPELVEVDYGLKNPQSYMGYLVDKKTLPNPREVTREEYEEAYNALAAEAEAVATELLGRTQALQNSLIGFISGIPGVRKVELGGSSFRKNLKIHYKTIIFAPQIKIYRPGHGEKLRHAWACKINIGSDSWRRNKANEQIFYRGDKDFNPKTVANWLGAWFETNFEQRRADLDESLDREKREKYVEGLATPPNVEVDAGWSSGYELTIKELSQEQLEALLERIRTF